MFFVTQSKKSCFAQSLPFALFPLQLTDCFDNTREQTAFQFMDKTALVGLPSKYRGVIVGYVKRWVLCECRTMQTYLDLKKPSVSQPQEHTLSSRIPLRLQSYLSDVTTTQYSVIAAIFYVGYALAQQPAGILLGKYPWVSPQLSRYALLILVNPSIIIGLAKWWV